MPTVFIPTPMRKVTNNQSAVATPVGKLSGTFAELEKTFPGLSAQLYDADGRIKKYINIFVNGDEISTLQGLDTQLNDRDEVFIVPAMAGG
jgi:molybdopterin converting factor small subunit